MLNNKIEIKKEFILKVLENNKIFTYSFFAKSKLEAVELLSNAEVLSIKTRYSIILFNKENFINSLFQLIILLKSSIPLNIALEKIYKNTNDNFCKKFFFEAYLNVNNGINLSRVFKKYEKFLGEKSSKIILYGEKSGELIKAIELLKNIYQKEIEIFSMIKKATSYPIFLFFTLIISIYILIHFTLNNFKNLYMQYNLTLPKPTQMLFDIYSFLNHYYFVLFFLLFLAPLIKKIPIKPIIFFNLYIYSFILANTLKFMNILDSLEIARNSLNKNLAKKAKIIEKELLKGASLYLAMKKSDLFDPITLEIIRSAQESSYLPEGFEKISNYYLEKFNKTSKRWIGIIEPTLILILALFILFIALGLMMPIWKFSNLIRI